MKILTMFLFDLFLSMYYVFSMALMLGCPKTKVKILYTIYTYNMDNSVSKQQTIRLNIEIKII